MKQKKKVLVIIAHPDDEIIWVGGTLIRNKNIWDTTIICLCRESDKDRNPKFKKSCEILNAHGDIFDLDDEELSPIESKKFIDILLKYTKREYDIIYTHGKNGEYGHIRHKEIHNAVMDLIKQGKLKTKKLFFFSYLKKENNHQGYAVFDAKSDIFIKLNEMEISLKKEIIQSIYGYSEGGFEEKSSSDVEAFKKLK